jgi:glycerophosphoryl diester phosphodiesterase
MKLRAYISSLILVYTMAHGAITHQNVLKIGHRGACGYAPENTLLSFAIALTMNVSMIEFDVYQCASGHTVVIHDETVDRTTNGTGEVATMRLEQLKALDAGKGQIIPTLQEVLDLADHKAMVNIELKGKNTASPVAKIIDEYVLTKGWNYHDFVISSFDHEQLYEIHALKPHVRIAILSHKLPAHYRRLVADLKAESINLKHSNITQDIIHELHAQNIKICAWTVNSPADITRLVEWGIDGIFSDFPDRL